MRVIYCDPALRDFAGHFGSHCAALTKGFVAAGAEVVVLGASSATAAVKDRLGALPAFTASPFRCTSSDPLCGWIKSFLDVASTLCSDLRGVNGITNRDLIYFDAATPAAIHGLCLWLESLGSEAPRCVVNLIEQSGMLPHELADGRVELRPANRNPVLYRLASVMMREDVRPLLRFVSIEPQYATIYSQLLERPVAVLPHPFTATRRERPGVRPGEPTIGFLGAQRSIKGFGLVPGIVRHVLRSLPDARIVIHDSRGKMRDTVAELQQIERQEPRLRLILGTLSPEDYASLLDQCDMLVAPYSRPHYAVASSGIAHECLANAIPLVATSGTTLARDLIAHDLESLVVADDTPDGFGAAVHDAIATWPLIVEKMRMASRRWGDANGPLRAARAILGIAP